MPTYTVIYQLDMVCRATIKAKSLKDAQKIADEVDEEVLIQNIAKEKVRVESTTLSWTFLL